MKVELWRDNFQNYKRYNSRNHYLADSKEVK